MSFVNKINKFIDKKNIKIVIGFAIVVRLIFVCLYGAITLMPDSYDYLALSNIISESDWSNYTAKRTPGFPVIISLLKQNLKILVAFQLLLGVLSTVLLYKIILSISKNRLLSFWTAIIYTSFANVILFDFAILTEALTTFILLTSIWLVIKHKLFNPNSSIIYYLVLSCVLSWLYLIKPFYIYVPFVFVAYFFIKSIKLNVKKVFFKSIIILSTPILFYFLWNNFNQKKIGVFTNTQYFGINLAQTATPFFEKAPNKDGLIRDIIVKHRDSLIKHDLDKVAMSVWSAHDELLTKTKLTEIELSNKLGEISKQLFKDYPLLYLKQVSKSWLLYWGSKNSLYWNYKEVKNLYFKKGIIVIWSFFQQYILIVINILFLIFSFLKLLQFFNRPYKALDVDLFIVSVIIIGSLAQALVAYGENSRYCFPFFGLILYFVIKNLNKKELVLKKNSL